MKTHVEDSRLYRISHSLINKGRGRNVPKILGPTYAHKVEQLNSARYHT